MVLKPKCKLLLICLVTLFFSAGCVGSKSLKVGTSINNDGSGKRIINFTLDKKTVASVEKESKVKFETYLSKKFPAGTSIKTSQKNNSIYYTITTPFKKVDDIAYPLREIFKKNGNINMSLAHEDSIFAVSYDLKEELNLKKDSLGKIVPKPFNLPVDSLEIEYWTQLPGEIRETSGTPITMNKAVWKLEAGKTYKVRTKSLLVRWWLIAFTGITLLLIIGALSILIINRRSARE